MYHCFVLQSCQSSFENFFSGHDCYVVQNKSVENGLVYLIIIIVILIIGNLQSTFGDSKLFTT